MEYEVLYYNDDGSAKVRMIIGSNVLEQDFPTDSLDKNVKLGLAIFQADLSRNVPVAVDDSIIGTVTTVKLSELPIIPPEDFQPEQPLDIVEA